MSVVYALHLPDEEYRYIGVSCEPEKRFWQHFNDSKRGNTPKHAWLRKHPNAVMTVLANYETYEQALSMEQYWIQWARFYGASLLNLTEGGEGTKGYKPTGIARENMRKAQAGRKHTEETKRKIGLAHRGRPVPTHVTEAARKANTGRVHTEEHRRKNSEANTGRQHKPYKNGSSIYKGVSYKKQGRSTKRWTVKIRFGGKTVELGQFKTELEAAFYYDSCALALFGEKAVLNFYGILGRFA